MIKIKNIFLGFHNYREEKSYTMHFLCTCGYEGEGKGIHTHTHCPNCGTKVEETFRYFSTPNKHSVREFDCNIKDKSLYCEKQNRTVYLDYNANNDKYFLNIKDEYFVVNFDFMADKKLVIRKNGKVINNTQNNLSKSLSYFEYDGYDAPENTLFGQIEKHIANVTTLHGAIRVLIDHPEIEIIYNTYGNLSALHNFDISMFHNGSSPHQVLGLSKPVCKAYFSKYYNVFHLYERKEGFEQIKKIDETYPNKPDKAIELIDSFFRLMINMGNMRLNCFRRFINLVEKGFDCTRLAEYLAHDVNMYQGITNSRDGLNILYDYVHMCEKMGVEYEKYPKSLKLRHDIASKNFEIKKSEYNNKKLKEVVSLRDYKTLQYNSDSFSVLIPRCVDDLINEGKKLHHCVASYIDYIIDKTSKILFYRNTDDINTPLVTLEVKGDTVVQYRGMFDRKCTTEEMKNIAKWAKVKGLYIR
ncbi:MAG: PcfJ domain-containing protein [Anaerostipes sp.]|uniref:PcfJ domain-containing protein n=1 Tax=Anaerostipes sp. TaxID=1872530 RepID=UPI0039968ED9